MTFDQQKREAIATAKHLVEILSEVCDESPSTTPDERKWMLDAFKRIKAARLLVLSILDSQDNPE
jgi:hypothetical protein